MRIAVGVDAGGSATLAAANKAGVFAGTARGGPANANSLGIAAAAQTIVSTVRALLHDVEPTTLYVGAAGAGRDTVIEGLSAALRAAFPRAVSIVVADDAPLALRAAIPAGAGAVLIAGTGAVAYAEHGDRRIRLGGEGFLLGDEGSGFAIGLAAVRRAMRTFDGRASDDETTALVKRHLLAADRSELLEAIYTQPLDIAKIAALAPSIIAFAGKGNRVSTKIVQDAAQRLGDLLGAAVSQAGLTAASPQVALAGGLLRENSLLTFLLETRLAGDIPGIGIVRQTEITDDAAAREALRRAEMESARV